jgi:hypothetical protein
LAPAQIRGRAEATYQPVPRQRDPNRVGDVETNRAQLNDDATVDERNPLDAMRLRVVEPNNITSPQVMSCDLVHRHVPSVGEAMAPPPTDSATVDQGSSMRKEHRLDIRRSNAHPSLMSHTTPAHRSGRTSSDRSTPVFYRTSA